MSALGLALLLLAVPARAAITASTACPGITIDDRSRPAEREAIESALVRLQSSPLGREKEAERRRVGLEAVVTFAYLESPGDEGLLGRTEYYKDSLTRVLLKETLMPPATGLQQTFAHELYGHALSRALAPPFLRDHLFRLEEEEANACLIGAVVARELGLEETPDWHLDTLLGSATVYHAELLFADSPDKIVLSLTEARDPAAAISARLSELARRRRSLDARAGGDRVWRAAFAHFEKVHGMPRAAFASARNSIEVWHKEMTVPRRTLLDRAEPHLKSVIPYLDTAEGLDYARVMIALSRSPHPAALVRENEALAKRLTVLRAAAPKSPEPAVEAAAEPAGALSWEAIQELYDRDHAEHPGHWKDEARSVAPQEWLQK